MHNALKCDLDAPVKITSTLLFVPLYSALSTTVYALSLSEAPIQQVTLYPNSAKIERSIPVKAGEHLVTFDGLPANFDISQLQYQTSNIDVNAVSHQDSALNKPAGQESHQLKNEIKLLETQISAQRAIIQAAELQNKFLTNLTTGSGTKVRNQAYDAFIAIDAATQQKKELEQRHRELQQDLNAIGDHQFNQRSLKFYVQAAQKGEIKISYIVPYARWQPIYKAELNSAQKQITLTRMAMLSQKTGEDWNNVKLVLSTAQPQGQVRQVTPEPWSVNYYEPTPIIRPAPVPMAAYAMTKERKSIEMDNTVEVEAAAPQFPEFEANELNYSAEFRTDTKTSLASSQQQIYLPLKTEQFPVALSVWVIPRQSPQATINAELSTLDNNWPSGMVKLYRDGDYIGQRAWNNSPDEKLNMNFGVDEQIQVKVVDLVDKKNMMGKTQAETLQKQQYVIQNLHNYPVQVSLFDAVPQSRQSQLSTQSSYSIKPSTTTWQGQPNINQWIIALAPQQKFELQLEHLFKYPSKGHTSGF